MVTNGANRYGVYTGSVAITIAVVICKTSISSRPHENAAFATATLGWKKELLMRLEVFTWGQ